jgi:hypothetical protein
MRFMYFVKMDETKANPPQALMDAMEEYIQESAASGVFVDGGGFFGSKDTVEFRVSGGQLTVTDGPYTEAKEVVGGWAIIKLDNEEEARAEAEKTAELHRTYWPEWEGAIEMRRIAEPEDVDGSAAG